MLASGYDDHGPAADVLHVGELPDPVPGRGEVRVRVTVSGVCCSATSPCGCSVATTCSQREVVV